MADIELGKESIFFSRRRVRCKSNSYLVNNEFIGVVPLQVPLPISIKNE